MRKFLVSLALLSLVCTCSGCATTIGNIGLGLGLGVAGTIGGIYCALAC